MSLLLDLTRAKEFAQEPEQLQQLLVTFEHSLAQELLELDAAFAHGNTQKAEHALHALGPAAMHWENDAAPRTFP